MGSAHSGFDGPPALVAAELRGYRRFRLVNDGLYPTVHATGRWSGHLEYATCTTGNSHPAPAVQCGCGLYGWYHPADASTSGFGDVTAAVAARGRCFLGDHGFRAASARVEAVVLPWTRSTRRIRKMLACRYPQSVVYRTRRSMLRHFCAGDRVVGRSWALVPVGTRPCACRLTGGCGGVFACTCGSRGGPTGMARWCATCSWRTASGIRGPGSRSRR